MEIAVRPAVTTGVALAAAGMIAVTPVASVVPDVQVPEIQLTADDYGFSATLDGWMQGFNTALIGGLSDLNQGLHGGELGLEALVAPLFRDILGYKTDVSILNGIPNRLFNVFNMALDSGQQGLLGLLGGSDGSSLTDSLIVGGTQVFNPESDFGGLENMFGQALKAVDNLTGFPGDGALEGLQDGISNFNTALTNGLTEFNTWLVEGQRSLEMAVFGVDHAFNGALNRGFDMFNSLLGAGQRGLLGVLGADFSGIAHSLSVVPTESDFPFAGIGGLEGILGNGYLLFANLIGGLLNPGGWFVDGGLLNGMDFLNVFDPSVIFNPLDILGMFL
ncbi:hypothetical protein ABQE69_00430 [Mycolicibacillus trivialis]